MDEEEEHAFVDILSYEKEHIIMHHTYNLTPPLARVSILVSRHNH